MNANEVIAALAGDGVHPNDHVNMGQSSNDVFPSAVHLAALDQATNQLLPALQARSSARSRARPSASRTSSSPGRTHLMDAVPVTLGQEFARLRRAGPPRPGAHRGGARPRPPDPARRHGDRHRAQHAPEVRREGPQASSRRQTKLKIDAARRPLRGAGQPRRARRAVRRAEGRRRLADEDRAGPRAHGLGPARRHRRDLPARAAEGLVDHARQGQPGHPRGRPPGRRAGHRQRHGDHHRRHAGPVRAQRAHPAHRAQPAAVDPPALDRVASPSPRSASTASRSTRRAPSARPSRRSPWPPRSTSTSATTRATTIVKKASESGRPLRDVALEEGVDAELYDRIIDLRQIAAGAQRRRARRTAAVATAAPRRARARRQTRRARLGRLGSNARAPRRPPASAGRRR